MMWAYVVESAGDPGRVLQVPKPAPAPGFALIRVLRAGVCNTDLEILKGYMGFTGVLGHEFVGVVEQVNISDNNGDDDDNDQQQPTSWVGQRVCGDINVGCAACDVCRNSDPHRNDRHCPQYSRNHCPDRTVLGILKKDGTMAEYLTLPVSNLHKVPAHLSDQEAVFAEPLAAACRIPEQQLIRAPSDRVAILGDGKLGLMIAEVLGRLGLAEKPVLFGKHAHKMDLVRDSAGVVGLLVSECQDDSTVHGVAPAHHHRYDVVVDATGSPAGLALAAGLCRPMGTLCLKSTCATGEPLNAAPLVVDELRVVGSRCGPIDQALELLAKGDLHVEKYVTKCFPLAQAADAITCAAEKATMKVQIICSEN